MLGRPDDAGAGLEDRAHVTHPPAPEGHGPFQGGDQRLPSMGRLEAQQLGQLGGGGFDDYSGLGNLSDWTPVQSCVTATEAHTGLRIQFYPGINAPTTEIDDVTSSPTGILPETPTMLSENSTAFTVGMGSSFVVTGTGSPSPILTESGALPSGVTFSDSGNGTAILMGTPSAGSAGTYPITITASNGVPPDATQSFTLTVLPIGITTTSLPPGSVKTSYSATLTAAGGNPPYKWSLAKGLGPLPPGLKLKPTGVISGKPKKAGTYTFTVQVVDTKTKTKPHPQNTATQTLSVTIS